MGNTSGTQQAFFDHYVEKMEVGLVHSWRFKWTNVAMKWRYKKRRDDEMIIETDFSADFEFRPANAECCAFYTNARILPFIVHYTNKHGVRRKDAVIVCSNDRGKNFKVHKYCLQKVLDLYLPDLQAARTMRRVSIATDNYCKQYRNASLYGWFTTFCKENGVSMGYLYQV
jgi:hypothetical protein